jgi:heme A synthase
MKFFLSSKSNFTRYAWVVVAYLILVILWGAYVRATGSGAGCGSHWPLCNGVVVPREPRTETIIEFTHRITSAFSGLMVIGLLLWAFRLYPKGHLVRRGAVLSLVFIITEGLLGAGLVLFEWVAYNASVGRAISMGAHLINTFLLLAATSLTAWWAGVQDSKSGVEPRLYLRDQGRVGWLIAGGLLLMVALGASGAVTALGDTLFPSGSMSEGIAQDFLPTAHFLVRLRIYHPILAIVTGISLFLAGRAIAAARPGIGALVFSRAIVYLVVIQLVAGFVNVLLNVPVWMQLVHLLLADLLWIAFILLSAAALSQPAPAAEPAQPAAQIGD